MKRTLSVILVTLVCVASGFSSAAGLELPPAELYELEAEFERDFVPSSMGRDLYRQWLPAAKEFANPKRRLAQITIKKEIQPASVGAEGRYSLLETTKFRYFADGFVGALTKSENPSSQRHKLRYSLTLGVGGVIVTKRRDKWLGEAVSDRAYYLSLEGVQGNRGNPRGSLQYTLRLLESDPSTTRQALARLVVSSNACTVGDQKAAAELHPNLAGSAIQLDCNESIGGKPKARVTRWFLQDYRLYVEGSFTSDVSAGRVTIADVRDAQTAE
jgi:hypothetical protein